MRFLKSAVRVGADIQRIGKGHSRIADERAAVYRKSGYRKLLTAIIRGHPSNLPSLIIVAERTGQQQTGCAVGLVSKST